MLPWSLEGLIWALLVLWKFLGLFCSSIEGECTLCCSKDQVGRSFFLAWSFLKLLVCWWKVIAGHMVKRGISFITNKSVSISKRKDNMCFNYINHPSGFSLPCLTLSVCLLMWLEGDRTALSHRMHKLRFFSCFLLEFSNGLFDSFICYQSLEIFRWLIRVKTGSRSLPRWCVFNPTLKVTNVRLSCLEPSHRFAEGCSPSLTSC